MTKASGIFTTPARTRSGTNKLGTGKLIFTEITFLKASIKLSSPNHVGCRGVQVVEYMYGGAQSESQDLTCPKCSEHIELEPSAQSFVLRP